MCGKELEGVLAARKANFEVKWSRERNLALKRYETRVVQEVLAADLNPNKAHKELYTNRNYIEDTFEKSKEYQDWKKKRDMGAEDELAYANAKKSICKMN